MTELEHEDRMRIINESVGEVFNTMLSSEMPTPEEAGVTAAKYAFHRALDREQARVARRRSKQRQ